MIQDTIFIYSDPYMQKRINLEKMQQKQGEAEMESGQKRVVSHTLDINFIA